ncbi:MAG: hypothetical protein NVSMB62_06000 [Acidobacteriaceae bacterium]
MSRTSMAAFSLSLSLLVGAAGAQQGPVPQGVPHLDHVFVIMMENHGYGEILNNPNAPFINQLARTANTADNYFAIAHPSLTNYLETVGGSNFGILNDNSPDWHNATCTPNLLTGVAATDKPQTGATCPISGIGTDAATPAIDFTNETSGPPGEINIDGKRSIPADSHIIGKTIADQLVAHGLTWKAYEESLPLSGADLVNNSDGFFSNLTNFSKITPAQTPPFTQSQIVALYAVKHTPFAYFRDIQEGIDPHNSLKNVVDFESPRGLFADLATGHVPTYSFIAPNQCNDQHGKSGAGPFCAYDPHPDGTQAGLNPALIYRGDVTVQRLVTSIKKSPAWHEGKDAIVIMWDENDYSISPITNQVLVIVDTNYGTRGVKSAQYYNHFSLLKTVEAGLGLPCLNHACDADVKVMSDLFQNGRGSSTDEGDNDE